ncbi:porin [Bradyrhizobium sp. A5]|uniref:porin n=1 Tax=Bradyrhizobium sp. A5 TaxID=3133696 RepID=UPI0032486F5E
MRTPPLILISLLASSAAAAEALRLPATEPAQASKTLPLKKGTGGMAKAGACASYGRGYYMVEGTGTCVKIGGSISVETTVRR